MNAFAKCETFEELLGQLAGAASVCWEPKPTGVFDSTQASSFVDQAHSRMIELMNAEHQGPVILDASQ